MAAFCCVVAVFTWLGTLIESIILSNNPLTSSFVFPVILAGAVAEGIWIVLAKILTNQAIIKDMLYKVEKNPSITKILTGQEQLMLELQKTKSALSVYKKEQSNDTERA